MARRLGVRVGAVRPLSTGPRFAGAAGDGVISAAVARAPRGRECNRIPPATDRPWPLSPEEVGTAVRNYEVMVILDPSLEERTIEPSLTKYLNVVTKDGGTVDSLEVWGRRRLAYEIAKHHEGIYAVIQLTAEPDTVKELDRQLTLNESILRTKVIRPTVPVAAPAS